MLGTGDLSELALGWCTYGVGDQMSHYDVNAGVPKTLIQHLIRWVDRVRRSSTPTTNDVLGEILDAGDHPRADPDQRGRASRRRPRTPSGPTPCRTSRSTTCCAAATGRRKIAFLAWHAWRDADAGEWPPGFPDDARTAYDLADDPALAARSSCKRFFASQFKRSALPNGPKVSAGGTHVARAATGGCRPTPAPRAWLAELEANVPTGLSGP